MGGMRFVGAGGAGGPGGPQVESHWDPFGPGRITVARQNLLQFLELPDLRGRSFLDVGAGGGLCSLGALDAGADRVVSFDLDPGSVQRTRRLWEQRGRPAHWQVLSGSILDDEFLGTLEAAHVVYAWSVLHHTGQLWRALANAARLLRPDGVLYAGLYLTTPRSSYWREVKRKYNHASPPAKRAIELYQILRHGVLPRLMRLQNPLDDFRDHARRRGRSFMTDVRHWLGGYPYEHATIDEVVRFARKSLGLTLTNLRVVGSFAEYLLRK
jgi:SAM-dependent methyltransferase